MKTLSILNVLLILIIFISSRFIPNIAALLDMPEYFFACFYFTLISLLLSLLMAPIIIRHLTRYRKTHYSQRFYIILGTSLNIVTLALAVQFKVNLPFIVTNDIASIGLWHILLFGLSFNIILIHIETMIYKALTDRLSIAHVEGPTIVISALLFALTNVLAFMPFTLQLFPAYFISFFAIGLIMAYLYNQTNTLVVSQISLTIAVLLCNIYLVLFQ